MPKSTLAEIIPETCAAIYEALCGEYMQVRWVWNMLVCLELKKRCYYCIQVLEVMECVAEFGVQRLAGVQYYREWAAQQAG